MADMSVAPNKIDWTRMGTAAFTQSYTALHVDLTVASEQSVETTGTFDNVVVNA